MSARSTSLRLYHPSSSRVLTFLLQAIPERTLPRKCGLLSAKKKQRSVSVLKLGIFNYKSSRGNVTYVFESDLIFLLLCTTQRVQMIFTREINIIHCLMFRSSSCYERRIISVFRTHRPISLLTLFLLFCIIQMIILSQSSANWYDLSQQAPCYLYQIIVFTRQKYRYRRFDINYHRSSIPVSRKCKIKNLLRRYHSYLCTIFALMAAWDDGRG